jgi:prepilin-type N-terminal cleavage/methylation domain-containing protein/prepilin-type processing-associated H-X9-DG protein
MVASEKGNYSPAGERRNRTHASGQNGFTLIELLVVTAIVAVLGALTLASVSQANGRAEIASCGSNLRQWGMALSMYSGEEGFYPLYSTVEIKSSRVFTWHDLLSPKLGATWPQSEANAKSLPKSAALCPAYARMGGYCDQTEGSYGYNAAGATEKGTGRELGLGGISTSDKIATEKTLRPIPEANVLAPSQMIAIADSVLTTANRRNHPQWELSGNMQLTPFTWAIWKGLGEDPPSQFCAWATSSLAAMRLRHGGRWNVVFADGHVENLALKDLFNFRSDEALRRWNRDNLAHRDQVIFPTVW